MHDFKYLVCQDQTRIKSVHKLLNPKPNMSMNSLGNSDILNKVSVTNNNFKNCLIFQSMEYVRLDFANGEDSRA